MSRFDVAVVGGGPAGLAAAAAIADGGCSVLLVEAGTWAADRACGEGILPHGRRALMRLGVEPAGHPIGRIAWHDPRAGVAVAPLRGMGGVGVRRTVLSAALRARCEGRVELRSDCRATPERRGDHWFVAGETARFLVVAEGPRSATRKRLGLTAEPPISLRRFGWRQHLNAAPGSDIVEVHWADGCEAYVTPVASDQVGFAFLWSEGYEPPRGADRLWRWLQRFEGLAGRFDGAATSSTAAGIGPMASAASCATFEGGCFVGDALSFYDGITGEGLSAAFEQALLLGELLPRRLRGEVVPLEAGLWATVRRRGRIARTVLRLHQHPRLRQWIITLLSAQPKLFEWGLNAALGATGKDPGATSPH